MRPCLSRGPWLTPKVGPVCGATRDCSKRRWRGDRPEASVSAAPAPARPPGYSCSHQKLQSGCLPSVPTLVTQGMAGHLNPIASPACPPWAWKPMAGASAVAPCWQELCILVLDATQTTWPPVCRVPDSGHWAWGWGAGGTAHIATHLWARCEGHASLLPALGRPARRVLDGEATHTLASHSHGSG